MKALLCGLLALVAASPAIVPIHAMATRDARLQAILPDDCPLYTDIDSDLDSMGVDATLYPDGEEGDVALLTMAEWGYTGASQPPEGFGLYLYFYDPQGRDWLSNGDVTMAFADAEDGFYDNSFRSFRMNLIDVSDDGLFSKWDIDGAKSIYQVLEPERRRYLFGQATLTDGATDREFSFGIGKEYDWTGYPKGGDREFSTLTVSKTGFQHVRAEVHPFTSDGGGMSGDQTRPGWQFLNRAPFRSDIGLFSVAFSLPSWTRDFGDLVSVHYDYYKYRTNWIYSFGDPDDWSAVSPYVGTEALGEDMQYAEGKTPNFGFVFMALMDTDDIDTGVDTIEGEMPYARFYNNPRDTPIELRVDNPKWAFFLDESEWEEGHRYSSQELLSYARSYAGDTDRSDDLPVLNGTVSNELFYVPSYSRQGLFQKYGRVESEISRNDLLGKSLSGLLQSRMGTTGIDPSFSGGTVNLGGIPHYLVGFLGQGEVRIDGVTMSGVDEDTPLSDLYVQAMSAKDPETYAWTLGERSVPLLAEWSESDPVVKAADPEYVDGLDAFVSSQGDRDVYRLTYDASLTNSYAGWAGKTTSADGTWTAQTVQAGKTDAVFDFRFIDFTFRDDSETYVLPATSDPFDIIDDVDTNPIENPSLMPRWLLILIGCIAAVLVLVVLAVLFPVFRLVFKGLLYVVQFAIDLVYLVLVWWWLALIRKAKGEEVPPLWIFGKNK